MIEVVPKWDPTVQRLLRLRKAMLYDHSAEVFLQHLQAKVAIVRTAHVFASGCRWFRPGRRKGIAIALSSTIFSSS
jgi:hypothetical protein